MVPGTEVILQCSNRHLKNIILFIHSKAFGGSLLLASRVIGLNYSNGVYGSPNVVILWIHVSTMNLIIKVL